MIIGKKYPMNRDNLQWFKRVRELIKDEGQFGMNFESWYLHTNFDS